jgi:hypothetical protein
MERRGSGLGLYSPETTPSMESGDWEKDLATVSMESVDPVGVNNKMMETSLTCGPRKAVTQCARSGHQRETEGEDAGTRTALG